MANRFFCGAGRGDPADPGGVAEPGPPRAGGAALLDSLDLALISAGPCEVVAPLRAGDNYFTQEQFDEAARAGAVGQICLRFLDAEGAAVRTSLDDLVVGVTLSQLRAAGSRWMAAGGPGNYAIIRAALVGRSVGSLVTDTITAERLVSLAEGSSGRRASDNKGRLTDDQGLTVRSSERPASSRDHWGIGRPLMRWLEPSTGHGWGQSGGESSHGSWRPYTVRSISA